MEVVTVTRHESLLAVVDDFYIAIQEGEQQVSSRCESSLLEEDNDMSSASSSSFGSGYVFGSQSYRSSQHRKERETARPDT